jgi:hypothetical protein
MNAWRYLRVYFREIVARFQCEHCRVGWSHIRRPDTGEWCHSQIGAGGIFRHTLCRANKWRQRPMNDPEKLGW